MEELFRYVVFGLILAALFVYDAYRGILPNFITLPAIVVAVVWNMLGGKVEWSSMMMGAVVVGGFFVAQFVLSHGRWVGGGDIRMGVLMGVLLGFWPAVVAMFIAYILGASVVVILLLCKKIKKNAVVPFGPFLAVSAMTMLVWGEQVVRWYLQLLQ
jgi:leader peptidase (prepilin peptidase) / N-methyltransferase